MMTADAGVEKVDADDDTYYNEYHQSHPLYQNSIQIHDIWQEFKVRFTIFDPLYKPDDEMWLKPNPDSGITA